MAQIPNLTIIVAGRAFARDGSGWFVFQSYEDSIIKKATLLLLILVSSENLKANL